VELVVNCSGLAGVQATVVPIADDDSDRITIVFEQASGPGTASFWPPVGPVQVFGVKRFAAPLA